VLVATESVFLFTAAPGLWDSSPTFFAATPAETQLERLVGSGRVGFQACSSLTEMPSLGILPEANSAYGVAELSAYDPTIPRSYFTSPILAETRTPPARSFGQFCPSVRDAAIARQYGVSFILGPAGQAAPAGTIPLAALAGEVLYRVPASGLVTLAPGPPSAAADAGATGRVLAVSDPDPSSLHFALSTDRPSSLYIHLTDTPGWSARYDGHPLALHRWDGSMLEAGVGPGTGTVTLTYRPTYFTRGVELAAAVLVGLVAVACYPRRRAARRRRAPDAAGPIADLPPNLPRPSASTPGPTAIG
jgi:hypothetical protein